MRLRLVVALLVVALLVLACARATTTPLPSDSQQPTTPAQPTTGPVPTSSAQPTTTTAPTRPPAASSPILIGTEYVLIDNPARTVAMAELLKPIGLAAAKPLAEHIEWDAMQPAPDAALDFGRLDDFVRAFQGAGFTDPVVALRSRSSWASRGYGLLKSTNEAPKREYMDDYAAWIGAIVERYDADGSDDMAGLASPVRWYEIGSEFSSYEPEPVGDYVEMLEVAYGSAHAAWSDVVIAHAAFLTTLAFDADPTPGNLAAAFQVVPDQTHSYADAAAVLDRPDLFDVVNLHAMGRPDEIADIIGWLRREMAAREYTRPIIVSDTGTTPFIAWGPANVCDRLPATMGRIIPPATEADRCRLADYFAALINADATTLSWARDFAAQDAVKKVVISAEQGALLVNTAYTEDLFWLKLPLAQAGAGNAAWAGLVDFDRREQQPAFYALQQLIARLGRYDSIARVAVGDAGLHVYEVGAGGRRSWICWYEPGILLLPADVIPTTELRLEVSVPQVTIELMAVAPAGGNPVPTQATEDGVLILTVGTMPVYIGY